MSSQVAPSAVDASQVAPGAVDASQPSQAAQIAIGVNNATARESRSQLALRITEIFFSLQGEARTAGIPTVFIRLTGCPLRCTYCDSAYAFYGGEKISLSDILARTASFGAQYVCVTGGEPLAQKNCRVLLHELCDAGYQVSLETSGALDIDEIDSRVSRVVDLKTPGSKEAHRNRWENLPLLTAHDQLKFIITDEADFQWAKQTIADRNLIGKCEIWFSPSFGQVHPKQLAEWILQDRLAVRLQLQMHKYLWGDVPGH